MVKEFDPLDATIFGSTEPPEERERVAAAGLYAGRYQIEREVGRGGMGTVYRALDVMVGDVVALKVLDKAVTGATDQIEWFRREVRLARRITHPNVARTHDMGEAGGAHYITMEFVEGTTLQELLRVREDGGSETRRSRQALDPARAARVGLSVCEGLAAAHAAGVVHRDLKPANVLIDLSGRVVLTDFGIARALSDEGTGARTQGVVGTPLYMAPEQLAGLPVDQRADIYAIGLILFEMVTGALPFAGHTPIAAALARLTQPPPDPRPLRPGLPEPLAELIVECMAQQPEDRPASATAVAERLRAWLVTSGESLMGVSTTMMLAAMAAAAGAGENPPSGLLTPTQQQQPTTGSSSGTGSGLQTRAGMPGMQTRAGMPGAASMSSMASVTTGPSRGAADAGSTSASHGAAVTTRSGASGGPVPTRSGASGAPVTARSGASGGSVTAQNGTRGGPVTAQSGASGPVTTQNGTRGGPGLTQRPLRPLAPVPTAERALAVLPFRYIGPPDQGYLGDALTDELIDVLSRTRGLRVHGSGATAKYRSDRDPRAVGVDLGVDAVVDATVQATARQVRVAARLVEVSTGTQLWSDRFESGLEDLFELQDRISKRIAEALRVELSTAACAVDAPAEAIALYLRGRRKLMAFHVIGTDGAIELLEQALELAPQMHPAIACHAIACLRAWFMPPTFLEEGQPRDWEQEARDSVARAEAQAPDIAETHLARAMLGAQLGEWRETVKALVRALEIAPTYAHAHQYLAQLQCEAGNTKEGLERARLAFDLEPNLVVSLYDIARLHALHGDRAESEKVLDMVDRNSRFRSPTTQFRLRVAGWFSDIDTVRRIRDALLQGEDGDGFGRYVLSYARALAGEFDKAELDELTRSLTARSPSPRFYTLMCQNSVEIYCARGYPEDALRCLQEAADRVLIDIEWTDRCPLLTSIRGLPGFAEARRKIRQRVQAMWSL